MALLIVFMIALLILPWQMDAEKNEENILLRAGSELIETKWGSSILKFLNITYGKASRLVTGILATGVLILIIYYLIRFISTLIRWIF